MLKLPRLLSILAILVLTSLTHAGDDKDNWYTVEMAGQRAGWMHSSVVTNGDQITTTSKMHLAIKRGQAVIKIAMDTTFLETTAGKPISMTSTQSLSASPTTSICTFKDDGSIEMVTLQSGQKSTQTFPKPEGVWLTPAAADRYFLERFKAGATEIKLRAIDPSAGPAPVTTTHSGFEKTKLTLDGRTIDVTKMTSKTQLSALVSATSTEYVDEGGETVRTDTDMGIAAVQMIASTREKALADAPAPEIMVNTFIKPDKPIKDPRHAKKLVLLASIPSGDFPALPTTGSQKVESLSPTSARLTITALPTVPAPAPDEDSTNPAYLKATSMANIDDPEVQKIAKEAVESSSNLAIAKAEACRRFVHHFIKTKDLDVGFASASEVARNKEGDCTEHGVLLTALLRANGIRARAATGLIYADEFEGAKGIFCYHMWAQALLMIDGKWRWVDLDGTLPNNTPFDATHITLSTTDLADDNSISSLAAIAPLMGRLQIKVESAE